MKEIKAAPLLSVLLLCLVTFCVGYALGREENADAVRIYTERTASTTAAPDETDEGTEAPDATPTVTGEAALVNINRATAEELTALPGIGDTLAQRIVAYREEHGAFASVEAITEVSGIGEKRFEAIQNLITVEEPNENTDR